MKTLFIFTLSSNKVNPLSYATVAKMTHPSLFISHGSPEFALAPGRLGPLLSALGRDLPRPRAVLVMSPHWMQRDIAVLSAAAPHTIHDFGGFSPALHALHYPAPGAPEVAAQVLALLARHDIPARADPARGFDHGAWVPLRHLYPHAHVPMLQLSQPSAPSPLALLELGRVLAPLREEDVLIVGSGSLTHNLREFRLGQGFEPYVQEFADWVWARIEEGNLGALLDYRSRAPHAERAHPSDDHLLPLYFAIGAAGRTWHSATRLVGGVTDGVLSMDSFLFGARTERVRPLKQ